VGEAGVPIAAAKRAEMREVYLEHRTCQSVVKACDVSWQTAERYRVEDKWDKACARVDQLAEDLAVKKIGKRRADTIRIAYASIVKMAKDLESKTSLPWSAPDVDKMARLVELLSGSADSRPGIAGDGPVVILPDDGSDPDFTPPEPNAAGAVPPSVDPAVEVPGEPS